MNRSIFAGSGSLTRFILRRDRIRLAVWIICLAGCMAAFIPAFDAIFTTDAERMVMAEMMKNPAMVAVLGPVYGSGDYQTGAIYANSMLLFSAMIVGVMNIFLVSRHTRQDEEQGRLEMIRSLPVGRLANLVSTLAAAAAVNLVLAAVTGLSMYVLRSADMTLSGCMLYGAVLGSAGMFFGTAAALFCQFTSNNLTALGFSFLLLMGCYLMRAVGDIGAEILSLISPLGLILRTENFVRDIWWPVFAVLGAAAAVSILSLILCRIRDLNRGLISERAGKRHASGYLTRPLGLSFRLLKTSILIWAAVIFVFAAMYGSIFGDMEEFIASNQMMQAMVAMDAEASLAEQFIVMLMSVMAMICAVPLISFIHRIHSEEKNGYTEHLLGKAVTRRAQAAAYIVPAFLAGMLLMVLTALGFWSVGSAVYSDTPALSIFLKAALAYLPALWVQMGVSLVLVAYLPDFTGISYLYLGYTFVCVYMGGIVNLPEWMKKLSPFGHIPQIPVEEVNWVVMAILTVLAVLLGIAGMIGYSRRDVKYS